MLEGIAGLEGSTGRRLGDPESPLLVSVRSGAAVSMPGMMDTILNLGDDRRGRGGTRAPVRRRGLRALDARALRPRVRQDGARRRHRRARRRRDAGRGARGGPRATPATTCPATRTSSCAAPIRAVFGSWSSRRAKAYRKHWGISEDGGTAVIVQAMVFGNLGGDSGTGVLFTRDPLSGDARARTASGCRGGQGEDVVSGTHDPLPLAALARRRCREAHDAPARGRASCSSASTATSRTSSSPSSAARSTCCRRARPSARRSPPCGPPSTSPRRARSTAPRRSRRVSPEQLGDRAGARGCPRR